MLHDLFVDYNVLLKLRLQQFDATAKPRNIRARRVVANEFPSMLEVLEAKLLSQIWCSLLRFKQLRAEVIVGPFEAGNLKLVSVCAPCR